jgi:hypothetical protein
LEECLLDAWGVGDSCRIFWLPASFGSRCRPFWRLSPLRWGSQMCLRDELGSRGTWCGCSWSRADAEVLKIRAIRRRHCSNPVSIEESSLCVSWSKSKCKHLRWASQTLTSCGPLTLMGYWVRRLSYKPSAVRSTPIKRLWPLAIQPPEAQGAPAALDRPVWLDRGATVSYDSSMSKLPHSLVIYQVGPPRKYSHTKSLTASTCRCVTFSLRFFGYSKGVYEKT